jgi:hypothetical protein
MKSDEKELNYRKLVVEVDDILDNPIIASMAELINSPQFADEYFTQQLGWSNDLGRKVKLAVQLKNRFPEDWQKNIMATDVRASASMFIFVPCPELTKLFPTKQPEAIFCVSDDKVKFGPDEWQRENWPLLFREIGFVQNNFLVTSFDGQGLKAESKKSRPRNKFFNIYSNEPDVKLTRKIGFNNEYSCTDFATIKATNGNKISFGIMDSTNLRETRDTDGLLGFGMEIKPKLNISASHILVNLNHQPRVYKLLSIFKEVSRKQKDCKIHEYDQLQFIIAQDSNHYRLGKCLLERTSGDSCNFCRLQVSYNINRDMTLTLFNDEPIVIKPSIWPDSEILSQIMSSFQKLIVKIKSHQGIDKTKLQQIAGIKLLTHPPHSLFDPFVN